MWLADGRRSGRVALVGCLVAIAAGVLPAQSVERFGDRLSRMPVDRATTSSISGRGQLTAVLDGDDLTVTATFEEMSSSATAAHIHRAPRAQTGPVVFTIAVPEAASGQIEQTITLNSAQRDVLRDGRYYLQIHTRNNPGGELRGWLLPH